MRLPRIFFAVVLIAAVGGAAFGCGSSGVPETEYQALQTQLTAAQQAAADARDQVSELQQDLVAAQAETAQFQAQLADATSNQIDPTEYAALQQQYDDAAAEVDSLTAQLANAQDSYAAATAQIDAYTTQVADLQQQIDELSTPTPTVTETPLPLTTDNIKAALWKLINQERAVAGVVQLQEGTHLLQWTAQHVQQMATAHHTTIYTDAAVGTQAAMMAVGYRAVDEVAQATITTWKISLAWFEDQVLSPSASYGAVAVLQSGDIFYISFMSSNYP